MGEGTKLILTGDIGQIDNPYLDQSSNGLSYAVEKMKGYRPIVPFEERIEIVRAISYVDAAVTDTSRDKRVVWQEHRFDVIFKGDDWKDTDKGRMLEDEMAEVGARVFYFPYTQHTSSTMLRDVLTRLVQSL